MDAPINGLTAPPSIYEVGGRRFETLSLGFVEAIAEAHASHQRPRCMCLVEGEEMYVARLGAGYIVKRMPNTGSHHAPDCPSYEPPAEFSGLGQVLGSAISEDPTTGETTLKLDFALSKIPGRSTVPSADGDGDSVSTDGTKLSLRGLLHYLWDQAELTRWQPGFAGKRSWATVRKHLLQATEHKMARGHALQTRLYIPEVFSVDQRDAINTRRLQQWANAVASPDKPQQLMLLIAEVKEIVPARYGYKVVVKHVPNQAFALDEQMYRRLGRRFETELALWGTSDSLHMVLIATFSLSQAGVPTIVELTLALVTAQWLPVEDPYEQQLIDRLQREGRSFVKALRYNLAQVVLTATAILTDVGEPCIPLFIAPRSANDQDVEFMFKDFGPAGTQTSWIWQPAHGTIPPLPKPQPRVT